MNIRLGKISDVAAIVSYKIIKVRDVLSLIELDIDMRKGKRVTISLDEVITRSDGTKATMREFVKEMLHYNPEFHITTSPKGETWYLKKK